ncbi:transcriptional regulator, TetR family [Streptoalloteichus tenebrarius]|uniref:Transcriptional regulator, TetR family n=1 Tax=Streptoalloteichus tenebrarius (strain ATCC 17920 / DSM 40477 / JCM 4838 / CBS 697.72 / NBRC 16177 / NCIMB 11028 / NRRL B-12390 / A12253. 1 / ISP 5477) TaxID=1933 RepID=A0ABT1HPW0_STRSD|nr:TetR/AcrR family transcriptional regulator [Streptoalloteichus tenebrarius]MCP2257554.1 transcriptional regulator, TetR family [Streptoalloteichus tenebrarius]
MSATTGPKLSRRERLRAETTREITAIALRQMAAEGPGAISLRGIAREMGMTARAIYSYFPTRDDLVTALVAEVSASLADALERARDAAPATDPGARLLAWGLALREWALANPEGFRLVYGDPVPGYEAPAGGPAAEAARRVCCGLNRLVAEACAAGRTTSTNAANNANDAGNAEGFDWSDFPASYLDKIRADVDDLSPSVVALALRVWGRLHGLVTLEIYGHLGAVSTDPAALYRAEMLDLVGSLRSAPA